MRQPLQILAVAALGALGLAVLPSLLPAGPTSSLDASGFLAQGQLWVAAAVVFAGGFLTSLTPCVYPLIPITVGVFGARQADSRWKALLLTSAYVVGMGLVFSVLGVAAALSGKAFGSALGNPVVLVGLAVFMLVLASSMFGAFELALPTALATRLSTVGGAGVLGALLMGSVAGFLAAPCTGPVLTGVLTWVAQTRDPLLGGALLFVYAMGIGVPFFLLGVFTVRLPKGGAWMEWVKSVFGVALLALAAGYLRDAFPAAKQLLATAGSALGATGVVAAASALAFSGLLLGAIHLSFKAPGQAAFKGLGVAAVVLGLLVRGAPVTPAPGEGGAAGAGFGWNITFKPEVDRTLHPLDTLLESARADCKPVLIDFFADWCASCKELDELTYPDPAVVEEGRRFVKIKVDGTNDHSLLDELYARFDVKGLPTVVFIDPLGKELKEPRITGFKAAGDFVGDMQRVAVATSCAH